MPRPSRRPNSSDEPNWPRSQSRTRRREAKRAKRGQALSELRSLHVWRPGGEKRKGDRRKKEREIDGDTNKLDALYDEYQTACRAFWDARGPAVSALDDLLLISPNSEQEREALDQFLEEVGVTNREG